MISPHGQNNLVNQYIDYDDNLNLENLKKNFQIIYCDEDQVTECERIADGSLTPLTGFMNKDEVESILTNEKTLSGHFFPIPIVLPISKEIFNNANEIVYLADQNNNLVGKITEISTYNYDLNKICHGIFGTLENSHPGVKKVQGAGEYFLSGRVWIYKNQIKKDPFCTSPGEMRKLIDQTGWISVAAFQTRNVPHRAHEHLQRIALEVSDGLLIHPIVGWKKVGDYTPESVQKTYENMRDYFYPSNRIILSGLKAKMYYAGPKEAALHAIIRQNFGCTHFIVGRDHAGVGNFYHKYQAQEYCNNISQDLQIKFLLLKGPFYCTKCEMIVTEKTCRHDESAHIEVSGTIIRNSIQSGTYPPEYMIRKEMIDVLKKIKRVFI